MTSQQIHDNFGKILRRYGFRDADGLPLEDYEKFSHVVQNENNFQDRIGHLLKDCIEYQKLRDVFCNAASLADDPVHEWFEMSYAQYLTVPRSVLQSMPVEWQKRFVKCLEELDRAIDWRPETGCYRVGLFTVAEHYDAEADAFVSDWDEQIEDDFADYERGRRLIPSRSTEAR